MNIFSLASVWMSAGLVAGPRPILVEEASDNVTQQYDVPEFRPVSGSSYPLKVRSPGTRAHKRWKRNRRVRG